MGEKPREGGGRSTPTAGERGPDGGREQADGREWTHHHANLADRAFGPVTEHVHAFDGPVSELAAPDDDLGVTAAPSIDNRDLAEEIEQHAVKLTRDLATAKGCGQQGRVQDHVRSQGVDPTLQVAGPPTFTERVVACGGLAGGRVSHGTPRP